jgi:putative two-component system response regulator
MQIAPGHESMNSAGTVLVVDDHEATLVGLRELLQTAGYTVITERNGLDGLQAAALHRPDVVLLDVVMPGMSGVDVCKALKQQTATSLTPVVLISGSQDRCTRVAGIENGADDFLSKPIDADELRARVGSLMRVKRLTDALDSAETLVLALGKIVEARDPCTQGHCERLATYASALGARLGLGQQDLDALYRGAFLHDIGKVAVPDRVLLKPTRLDPEEYELMKQHPQIGESLCGALRSLERVRPIVRHHHERWDGSGYPDGLAGDDIPLLAQIVSVVDVFDALTSDRPYRKAMSTAAAYEMLIFEAEAGWRQRPLVDTFVNLHRTAFARPDSQAVENDIAVETLSAPQEYAKAASKGATRKVKATVRKGKRTRNTRSTLAAGVVAESSIRRGTRRRRVTQS